MKTYIDKYEREWIKIGSYFVKGYSKESIKVPKNPNGLKLKDAILKK